MPDAQQFTQRDVIPSRRFLTRDQVRRVDQLAIQQFGMSGLVLMENAGRGCVDVLCEVGIAGPVLICCGKGNNGGDGLVIARHLAVRGFKPLVLQAFAAGELKGDAADNFAILQRTSVEIMRVDNGCDWGSISNWFGTADWVVDALLGTGSQGEPRFPVDELIRYANAATARKMAIDLPSGMDCDTGQVAKETFRATHTCTLVAEKTGFQAASAQPFLGTVHVLDIGTPREVLDAALAR
jgi:NAD(P)H-hydrate epimerase